MSQFRPITPDDYAEVATLLREAFLAPAQRFGVSSVNCPVHPAFFTLDRLKREVAAGRRYFVVEDDNLIAGCISLSTDNDGTTELSRLAVQAQMLGEGFGTLLLESAIRQAAKDGASLVKVHVYAQAAELMAWYRKRGFELIDAFEVNDVPAPIAKMVRAIGERRPTSIRSLARGDEPMLERFLLKYVQSSAMLLSNLRNGGIVNEGRPRQATYVAAIRDGEVVGVVALCWNGMLLPQAPEMLDELARTAVTVYQGRVEGVIGLEDQVTRVAYMLSLPSGKQPLVMMDSHEILYALDIAKMKIPEALRSGRAKVRRFEPRDIPVLTDWMVDFNMEAMNRRITRDEVESNLLRSGEERDNRWVLESSEGLRATTGFNAATREVVQVGGVYTPPELRSRGYARIAVAGSLLEAHARGVPLCVLFTAEDNIPAQRAYEALGFNRRDRYRLLLFREPVRPKLNA